MIFSGMCYAASIILKLKGYISTVCFLYLSAINTSKIYLISNFANCIQILKTFWFSNLSTLRIPDENYRNVSCTQLDIYFILINIYICFKIFMKFSTTKNAIFSNYRRNTYNAYVHILQYV
jgi:hypothetical protein